MFTRKNTVSDVIIEAKHCQALGKPAIAQVMGYYCKAKEGNNQSGFAMLLNEFNEEMHVQRGPCKQGIGILHTIITAAYIDVYLS